MMKITMIGHSSVLIETQGKRLLTDPFFSNFGNLAYRRVTPPAMSRQDLANVDLVLVSHGHFDHVDRRFLRGLPPDVPVLAPGRLWLVSLRPGKNLLKMETWKRYTFGDIAVTAVPAIHTTTTNGFVIESEGLTVYFAGDTYYNSFMTRLRQQFRIDVALMPVTTFRIPMTMGEREAVRAVQVLEPNVVIPIHLGIQPRSFLLRTGQSPEGFARRLHEAGSPCRVEILREGMSWIASPADVKATASDMTRAGKQ